MPITSHLINLFAPLPRNNHRPRLLTPQALLIIAGLFLFFNSLSHTPASPSILGYASNITVDSIISLSNQKRQTLGETELTQDPALTQAAQEKANHMFSHDYWAHVSPDGTEPWFFINNANYKYLLAGENLARDFNDSSSVVEAWMNSPSHRDNLLNPKYRDIGVAVVNGQLGGIETTLVVQMFGTRLSSSPQLGASNAIAKTAQAADLQLEPTLSVTTTPEPISPTPTILSEPIVVAQTNQTNPRILVSPMTITRGISSFVLLFIVLIFIIDAIIIWRNKIVRISSDSAAHIAFLLSITAAIWLIKSGVIL